MFLQFNNICQALYKHAQSGVSAADERLVNRVKAQNVSLYNVALTETNLKVINMQIARASQLLMSLVIALSVFSATAQRAPDTTQRNQAKAAEAPKEGLRPDVAKHLQAAQQMIQMKQFKEALAKIVEAEVVANRTPYENFVIDRMRGTAAAAAGDNALSAKSFTAALDTGRLNPEERLLFTEAITAAHYNQKDYKQAAVWATRALKEGSVKPQTRMLLIQAHYLANDFDAAKAETTAAIATAEAAGNVPSEDLYKMQGRIAREQKDQNAYTLALEKLVMHYPTPGYWADWIARVATNANMTDRYMQDVFRLQLAHGEDLTESQYVFLARNAIQDGFPIDARQIIELGYNAKVLGTKAEHKTLRDKTNKDAADDVKNMTRVATEAANLKTGPALFNTGRNFVISGDVARGIPMMEEGIKRTGIKRPEDAKLRLGITYALVGERDKAIATLTGLSGPDGLSEVVKLWLAFAKGKPAEKKALQATTPTSTATTTSSK